VHFTKLEALGNDFLLIESRVAPDGSDLAGLARQMCRRTLGAGADGLLVLGPPDTADSDVATRIFNADGSEAEVSGNGTRCVAAFLDGSGRWPAENVDLRVATSAGVKRLRRLGESRYEMEMGIPTFRSGDVPFTGCAADERAVDVALDVSGRDWTVTVSSIGNPHCSIFIEDPDAMDWRSVGAVIETHPAFPNRVNVEFIRVTSRNDIDVRFWERGVGETQSSGTGATAATVAAIATGRVDRRVTVRTAAGNLSVSWPDDQASVLLVGPARAVYRGEWLLPIE
jgi:diaminopimelate epimerase